MSLHSQLVYWGYSASHSKDQTVKYETNNTIKPNIDKGGIYLLKTILVSF